MRRLLITKFILLLIPIYSWAQSSSPSDAKWIIERLTGVRWPQGSPILVQAENLLARNDKAAVAQLAMSQTQFYNITVKQLALQMSTREETIRTPFNDFAASFIGVTRDDIDARQLLIGNFYYAAADTKIPTGITIPNAIGSDIVASNKHYAALESNRLDLGDVLEKRDGQLIVIDDNNTTATNPDAAGVLTSRTFLEAHATAGTNRRLVEFVFREFMCASIDQVADTMAPDIRVGRDIDRFPGGDHNRYQTTCKGCHTIMDGFRGAFAYWDFNNGAATYSLSGGTGSRSPANDGQGVINKLNKNNNVYPGGYVTRDNSWINNANRGANSLSLGWRNPASSGQGVAGFAQLISNSQRFSKCMAKRVYKNICRRDLPDNEQQVLFSQLAAQWESSGYKMKKLFEAVVTSPSCRAQSKGNL